MDDQRKLSELVRGLAGEIRLLAMHLSRGQNITSMTEREAGRLVRLSEELVSAVASARAAQNREAPITFVGPPMKFCNALVTGGGVRRDLAVPCNRVLRDDGTCSHAAQHIAMSVRSAARMSLEHWDGTVQYCREKVPGTGRTGGLLVTCFRFVVNGECPNAANHVEPDKFTGVTEAHRHVERHGTPGELCTAPLRADGTCTAYPAPLPDPARSPNAAACLEFEDDGGAVCARCYLPGSAHARGVL